MKFLDIIHDLNPLLTDIDHEKRYSGLELLVKEVTSSNHEKWVTKEVETLFEFLSQRLVDHKLMVEPSLRCLSYLADCPAKPENYNEELLKFLKVKINFQRLDPSCRALVYDMIEKILIDRKKTCSTINSDLIYSIIHLLEGESWPENILRSFRIVSFILKNFDELEPYLDDLFDWLGCYFPIDYTPKEGSDITTAIKRSDLVDALHECFFCNPSNGSSVFSILVATYEANSMVGKIEALECLIKSCEIFPFETIKEYMSTVWTSIRTQCLKDISLIDDNMLNLSYKLLNVMTLRLSEDDWEFKTFIGVIYEELALAFRKLELNLFEPAARLLVSAARPKVSGFNYIMDKILPLAITSMSSGDPRPITGLSFMFEELNKSHPNHSLDHDLDQKINKLALIANEMVNKSSDCLKLVLAILKTNIELDKITVDLMTDKLLLLVKENPDIVEDCLLRIFCRGRSSIIFDDVSVNNQSDLGCLLKSINYFDNQAQTSLEIKLNLYLRHLINLLDSIDQKSLNNLDQLELKIFIKSMRQLSIRYRDNLRIVDKSGIISGIIANKLDPTNLQPLMMDFFTSEYCQSLIPKDSLSTNVQQHVYLPTIRWFLKSLVIRNHALYEPLMNLIFNCMTQESLDDQFALVAAKSFSFAQSAEGYKFVKYRHYNIFPFHRQKLFNRTLKEVKIRYEQSSEESIRRRLICSIAFQLPHVSTDIYKRDIDWLVREIIKCLQHLKDSEPETEFISLLLNSLEDCIDKDLSSILSGFLMMIVEIGLYYSKNGKNLNTRRLALRCLLKLSICMNESDLLPVRARVVKGLKTCLADKKRLVRQYAAEARLRWTLLGQPVG